jgi:phosphoesterase family protein/PKD domain-containing protein
MRGSNGVAAVLLLAALALAGFSPAFGPVAGDRHASSFQGNQATFESAPAMSIRAFPTNPPAGVANPRPVGIAASGPPAGTFFDHVVIILMENRAICDILTSCGGKGPYETGLANTYGLATKDVDCSHPSLPNYLCLSGGSDFGCTGYDGNPNSNACTAVAWNSSSIVDRLVAANLTWKAYMENMPSNCYGINSGLYYVRHNPFVYYKDIAQNATRCARVVPSGTNASVLLSDLASASNASNYMWLTPNGCNDMHDCTTAVGDAYLSNLVPQILNSTVFKSSRAALYITFDEDSGGKGAPDVYTVWAGPAAKLAFTSALAYNHTSLLATLEANWHLTPLTANDTAAANMSAFFPAAPTARFLFSPSWPHVNGTITFNASSSSDPNPNTTLQFRWDWTNHGSWDTGWSANPIAAHGFGSAGRYTVRLGVKDSYGLTSTMTAAVVVDSEPPVTTGTLTGTAEGNGWYRSAVTVTLNATDDLSGVAQTNASVDGGGWQAYAGPFVIGPEGNHTVRFASVDNAGNQESFHVAALGIDETPPITSATLSGILNGSVFLTPINVTLHATDGLSGVAVVRYRVDSNPWANYTKIFLVGNTGTHTVRYESIDVAGNLEPTHSFLVINGSVAGIAAPVSTAVYQGTRGSSNWFTSSVNVTLELLNGTSPPDSIWYELDGGPWGLYATPFAITGDGIHHLRYNATNNAGLVEGTHNATIRIDTTPPASRLTLTGTLGQSGWYVSIVSASLAASDATSGVATLHYRVDNAAWLVYSTPFNLSDGRHALQYYATDVAGLSEPIRSANVSIDTIPPTTSGSLSGTAGQAGWYVSNVSASLTATDATSGVANISYRLDSGSWAIYAAPLTLGEGRHVLSYYATDVAGLSGSVQSTNVSIDLTPPETGATLLGIVGYNGTYATNVTVYLNATDNLSGVSSVTYRIDSGPWLLYGGPFLVTNGHHLVKYYSADVAGLVEAVDSHTINVDVATPVTTVTLNGTAGSNGWYVSNVSVSLNATDASIGIAYIAYRVDNGTWQNYSAPFVLGQGVHDVDYYAVDRAGHVEATRSQVVSIDLTPPVATAKLSGTPGNSGWYISNVNIALNATDNLSGVESITYRVDNGSWLIYTGPFVVGEGRHTIQFYATDRAGWTGALQSPTVSIDTTPPTTSANVSGTLGANGWYLSNVSVNLGATDAMSGVAKISYRVDNGSWMTFAGVLTLGDGQHLLEYFATDNAGLTDTVHSLSLAIDAAGPHTTVGLSGDPGADGWYISKVTVTLNATGPTAIANITYRVDHGPWMIYSAPFQLGEGRHLLEYFATDVAGVVEPVGSTHIDIDTTPPTSQLLTTGTIGNHGWFVSSVTFTLSATDATSGVAEVMYQLDGGPWLTYSYPILLGEGRHVVQYRAFDRAGLVEALHTANIAIDETPPTTSAGLSGTQVNFTWFTSNVTVTILASDNRSGVWTTVYRIDSGAWTPYKGPFVISSGGRHTLTFYSTDGAGNQEAYDSVPVNIETSAPYFTAISPSISTSSTPVTIAWHAVSNDSGINGYAISVDGGSFTSVGNATAVSLPLTVGAHVIRVKAIDGAGIATVASVSVHVIAPTGIGHLPALLAVVVAGVGVTTVFAYLRFRRRARTRDR